MHNNITHAYFKVLSFLGFCEYAVDPTKSMQFARSMNGFIVMLQYINIQSVIKKQVLYHLLVDQWKQIQIVHFMFY